MKIKAVKEEIKKVKSKKRIKAQIIYNNLRDKVEKPRQRIEKKGFKNLGD